MAFYFGWMNFYTTYIIMPALVGVAMYMCRPGSVTVDTDPYLPFFSVFMAIWAVLFVVVSMQAAHYIRDGLILVYNSKPYIYCCYSGIDLQVTVRHYSSTR